MTNDLAPFFSPTGVAIIGASTNPRKLSYGIVKNMTEYGFKVEYTLLIPKRTRFSALRSMRTWPMCPIRWTWLWSCCLRP